MSLILKLREKSAGLKKETRCFVFIMGGVTVVFLCFLCFLISIFALLPDGNRVELESGMAIGYLEEEESRWEQVAAQTTQKVSGQRQKVETGIASVLYLQTQRQQKIETDIVLVRNWFDKWLTFGAYLENAYFTDVDNETALCISIQWDVDPPPGTPNYIVAKDNARGRAIHKVSELGGMFYNKGITIKTFVVKLGQDKAVTVSTKSLSELAKRPIGGSMRNRNSHWDQIFDDNGRERIRRVDYRKTPKSIETERNSWKPIEKYNVFLKESRYLEHNGDNNALYLSFWLKGNTEEARKDARRRCINQIIFKGSVLYAFGWLPNVYIVNFNDGSGIYKVSTKDMSKMLDTYPSEMRFCSIDKDWETVPIPEAHVLNAQWNTTFADQRITLDF